MAPNFILKRKHSEISGTEDIGRNENALDSPTKRMCIDCSVTNERTLINTPTRESCVVSTDLDKEGEDEVLIVLIPRDEDSTEASEVQREAVTASPTDSKGSQPPCAQPHDSSEDIDTETKQTDTSESEQVTAFPSNEFYLGSSSPSCSRSPSPSLIFLILLQSLTGPSNLSNTFQSQQQENPTTSSQPVSGRTPVPISSHLDLPQQPSSPPMSIFETLQSLQIKYHPSPSSRQSRRCLDTCELSGGFDEMEEEEDENLDLIWAMFNGIVSTPTAEVGAENPPQYSVYIEEINLPGLEEIVTTNDMHSDNAGLESHKVWREHADGHLSEEPPPINTFRTHIQEEDPEDPEARLKRLVREGEMGSDGCT